MHLECPYNYQILSIYIGWGLVLQMQEELVFHVIKFPLLTSFIFDTSSRGQVWL